MQHQFIFEGGVWRDRASGRTLPRLAGGAEFRNADEVRARQDEIRSEVESLNQQYEGRAFSDADKGKWNAMNVEFAENIKLIKELDARERQVAALAAQDDSIEAPAAKASETRRALQHDARPVRRHLRPGQDPPALAQRRGREPFLLIDHAKRAVEESVFPHPEADDDHMPVARRPHAGRFSESDGDQDFDNVGHPGASHPADRLDDLPARLHEGDARPAAEHGRAARVGHRRRVGRLRRPVQPRPDDHPDVEPVGQPVPRRSPT
jgi:hypothetical protein